MTANSYLEIASTLKGFAMTQVANRVLELPTKTANTVIARHEAIY